MSFTRGVVLMFRSYLLYLLGRLPQAQQAATQARDIFVSIGDATDLKMSLLHLAMVEAGRGSYRAAAALAREGLALTLVALSSDIDNTARAWLASWEAAAGEMPPVDRSVDEVLAALPPARGDGFLDEQRRYCAAFVQACCGRGRQAQQALHDLAEACRRPEVPGRGIDALHLWARLGQAGAAVHQLPAFVAGAQSPVWQAQAAHIRALASRDPQALLEVSAQFEQMQMWHLAAETADPAGFLYASRGARGRIIAAAAGRRDQLLTHCDTGPLPWWPTCRRSELSPRELEIARLAADGAQNPDIANRLVISVRTVENHLQHVYEKLGIAGRHELPARLGRDKPRDPDRHGR